MSTLYLDQSGLEVRRDGDSLALYHSGALQRRVPFRLLRNVVVKGDVLLHSSALTGMSLHGCSLLVLPRFRSYGEALLSRCNGLDSRRRLLQYQLCSDESWRTRMASLLVRAKLRGHARLLFRASRQRPELASELLDGVTRLTQLERQLAQSPELAFPRLLGMEGAAAAAFFDAYQKLFAPSLSFTSRNRRPPRDPVNAALSLAYTLLHAECVSQILIAGLDPSVGFYHEPAHGRESLACDLLEVLRASAEEWVWNLFRHRRLQGAHFQTVQGACLLGKAGRRLFYEAFEELRPSSQLRLRSLLQRFVREIHHGTSHLTLAEA
jgi:CRISPR-associated protein Cas1